MIKSRSILAAVAVGTMVLASCSAGSTDYKKAAEKAINDSAELDKGTCVKPDSTDVGTTFDCTATLVADGSTIPLTATIDKKGHVNVGPAIDTPVDTTPVDDGTTDTTPVDDSTVETTAS